VYVLVYHNDILILSKNPDKHLVHVNEVLTRLHQIKLFVNKPKCVFASCKVSFSGNVISAQGLEPEKEKLKTISDWKWPKWMRELQKFLSFCNFYRGFIKNYSQLTVGLTTLLKGNPRFLNWTQKFQTEFDFLKNQFINGLFLSHPQSELSFVLETDASYNAIGGILSQLNPDGSLSAPVSFYSRTLTSSEVNYTTFKNQLLAFVDCFRKWRHRVQSTNEPFMVYTDHNNLKSSRQMTVVSQQLARWRLFLLTFTYI
jgi:RNase H-like domain found in reverse transcriptase